LALSAVGVGPGDEVLVPAITYVATFQAISATGAKPIACPIDQATLCLDPNLLERAINDRTKAIVPVHFAGAAHNIKQINALARNYGLRVIEDAAHAFGSKYEGRVVGSFGDVACFSFDGVKNITSGEGGCVVTEDRELASLIKDMRLLGVKNDSRARYQGKRTWSDFDVDHQGWRYHMSDIFAAIGIAQFNRRNLLFTKRQKAASFYDEILKGHNNIRYFNQNYKEIVPHIYPVYINSEKFVKEILMKKCEEQKIQIGSHYKPNNQLTFYKSSGIFFDWKEQFQFQDRLISLPLHPDIEEKQQRSVVDTLLATIHE